MNRNQDTGIPRRKKAAFRVWKTACTACILAGALLQAAQADVSLDNADSIENLRMTWAGENPKAVLEVNTDKRYVSEGTGSILARSVVPEETSNTSYIGFRLPVDPMRLDGRALAFEVWSGEPVNTLAFHVRGLNAKGEIVASWGSWARPLKSEGQTMLLVPGRREGSLTWEEGRIEAPDDEISYLEFIAGSLSKGQPYNMVVDHIRLTEAPPPPSNFTDHGIMAPVGMSPWGPGTVATVDQEGKRLIFIKLWTGPTASYLFIDAETGKTQQIYPEGGGWGAYRVLMTPEKVIYDTIAGNLVAIDAATRKVRRLGSFGSGMALGYGRAGDGTVYAGIYPTATLVSYNPATGRYINHGPLNDETWPQYLRPLVFDSSGWIYASIGLQEGQVVGFDPATGAKVAFIPKAQRQRGQPELFRGADGEVYANAEGWGPHRLSKGKAAPVEQAPARATEPEMTTFPDGSHITKTNIPDRKLFILDAGAKEPRELHFDYASTGVPIYTLISGPGGKIFGATGIPLRVWTFDPATGEMWNSGLGGYGGHINQFVRQGDKLFGAVYSGGQLLEYDPLKPFDDVKMELSANPRLVHKSAAARDLYGRPNAVLAHPDGRHILVGGKAARVVIGSGLLIYDIETGKGTMLDRSELMPDHGINAMVGLPDGDVLVGTSIHPPTAGSPGPAKTAFLYRLHMATRTVTERWPLEPESPAVRDLVVAADGLVYGLAEPSRLFVFDLKKGVFVHQENLTAYGDAAGYMAPRCMINGPDGAIYALFERAVVRIEPGTFRHHAIAWLSEKITAGIAIEGGRLYFACGPHLMSCALNPSETVQASHK